MNGPLGTAWTNENLGGYRWKLGWLTHPSTPLHRCKSPPSIRGTAILGTAIVFQGPHAKERSWSGAGEGWLKATPFCSSVSKSHMFLLAPSCYPSSLHVMSCRVWNYVGAKKRPCSHYMEKHFGDVRFDRLMNFCIVCTACRRRLRVPFGIKWRELLSQRHETWTRTPLKKNNIEKSIEKLALFDSKAWKSLLEWTRSKNLQDKTLRRVKYHKSEEKTHMQAHMTWRKIREASSEFAKPAVGVVDMAKLRMSLTWVNWGANKSGGL